MGCQFDERVVVKDIDGDDREDQGGNPNTEREGVLNWELVKGRGV